MYNKTRYIKKPRIKKHEEWKKLLTSTCITLSNIYKNARIERGMLVVLQKSTSRQVTFVEMEYTYYKTWTKDYL
jgi:hypothetical protein